MAGVVTHCPCPGDEQADGDVLVGDDGRRPTSPVVVTAGVLTAVGAAVLVGAAAVERSPDTAPLALRAGELVLPDRLVDDRLAEAGMHVEVVNSGERTLELRGATLVPGAWQVDVVDRPLVVPGESVVLSLHRRVAATRARRTARPRATWSSRPGPSRTPWWWSACRSPTRRRTAGCSTTRCATRAGRAS